MSPTVRHKYKYFHSTVQRAKYRRQKFHFLPFHVRPRNVKINLYWFLKNLWIASSPLFSLPLELQSLLSKGFILLSMRLALEMICIAFWMLFLILILSLVIKVWTSLRTARLSLFIIDFIWLSISSSCLLSDTVPSLFCEILLQTFCYSCNVWILSCKIQVETN